ncbi:MAG: DUF4129 domain-containing protein [Desulfurococcales archaeon]|nr:DUF4129 domain-containing protein [Desulfurococcales archaeon]
MQHPQASPGYRHFIPQDTEWVYTGGLTGSQSNWSTTTTTTTTGFHASTGHGAGEIQLVIATLIIMIVAILLSSLLMAREAPTRGLASVMKHIYYRFTAKPRYRYEGLKLELRAIMDELAKMVEGRGAAIKPGNTPMEIARIAMETGINGAGIVASIYYEGVYSPREPTPEMVEEARRALRGEG